MKRPCSRLWRNERAASLIEFALIAPIFCAFIVAIGNFGIIFFAQLGLSSAVAEGARFASIHPRPNNTQIIARINDRRYGMTPSAITGPTITSGTQDGRTYLDIEMRYRVTMNFVFFRNFSWSNLDLTERRRVFVY